MSTNEITLSSEANLENHSDGKVDTPKVEINYSNLRSAYMEWICNHQSQSPVFVTLATNCESLNSNWSSLDEKRHFFQNKVNSWDAAVCRHFIGKHYTDQLVERQSGMLWIEHESTNIHYHGSIDIHTWDISEYCTVGQAHWKRLVPSGTIDIQPVTDTKRLISYIMKEQSEWSFKNKLDQIIFLPHPNKSRDFHLP